MNHHKNDLYVLYKNPIFWNVLLSDLADEFLPGNGDDMCRRILPLLDQKSKKKKKKKKKKIIAWCQAR